MHILHPKLLQAHIHNSQVSPSSPTGQHHTPQFNKGNKTHTHALTQTCAVLHSSICSGGSPSIVKAIANCFDCILSLFRFTAKVRFVLRWCSLQNLRKFLLGPAVLAVCLVWHFQPPFDTHGYISCAHFWSLTTRNRNHGTQRSILRAC